MLRLAAGLGLLAMAAGCQDHRDPATTNHGEVFTNQESHDLYLVNDAQAARGARLDGTLHACHFSGDQVNSLGQDRLDLMLHDGGIYAPLVVWIDVPQDDQLAARQQSVSMFLKDRGMRDDQIKLELGPNPDSTTAVVRLATQSDEQGKQSAGAGGTLGMSGASGSGNAGGAGGVAGANASSH
jgi:hypothetical protein